MKIYGTVSDLAEKTPLSGAKFQLKVDDTELMTVYTDAEGKFEATQDLSDYEGQKLKVSVQKENFEDKEVFHEIGQEDIEISIELTAVTPVKPVDKKPTPTSTKDNKERPNNRKLMIIGGAICAIVVAAIIIIKSPSSPPTPPSPEIDYFKADPPTIEKGSQATLKWKTINADKIIIKGRGSVASSGSTDVNPTSTKTYVLVATNKAGKQSKTCTLKVETPEVSEPVVQRKNIVCNIQLQQRVNGAMKNFRGQMRFTRNGNAIKSGEMMVDFQGSDLRSEILSGTLTSNRFKIKYKKRDQGNDVLEAYGNVGGDLNQRFTITNGKYGAQNMNWQATCNSR